MQVKVVLISIKPADKIDYCLNASKTATMIVSRSRTMHSQSTPLTIGGTMLEESDDLDTLGVTFDAKMNFEKHLRSVSRAASQRNDILR